MNKMLLPLFIKVIELLVPKEEEELDPLDVDRADEGPRDVEDDDEDEVEECMKSSSLSSS